MTRGSRHASGFLPLVLFVVLSTTPCAWSDDASGYVRLEDGQHIYYEVSGEGCPVVLIAGGSGMDLRQWDDVFHSLAGQFRTSRYDPRGVGRSDVPSSPYSDADDLTALLDELGMEEAALVGISSAGGFALEYSLEVPERSLTVIASAPFVPGFELSDAMASRVARIGKAAQEGKEPFLEAMLTDPHFIPSPLRPAVRPRARANMGENYDKASTLDPSLEQVLDPPLIERLGEISAPTLLIEGALDHPDIHRRVRTLRDAIRTSRVVRVDDAGHNPQLENPEAFIASIVPALASACAAR